MAEVVRIAESYRNEENYTVWSALVGNLGHVGMLIQERRGPASEIAAYDRCMQHLLEPIGSKLGWVPAQANESMLSSFLYLFL